MVNGPSLPTNDTYHYNGGAIYCTFSSPIIRDCVINGNKAKGHGGGIYCDGNSSPTIINCIISSNEAMEGTGGGIYCNVSSSFSPTITNCIMSDNSANSQGGGIFLGNGEPVVTNCTFAGNSAGSYGGGITDTLFGTSKIKNCILYGNSAGNGGAEIALVKSGPFDLPYLEISYSDVEGGEAAVYIDGDAILVWDVSNITANPLFVSGSDYHLKSSSPCIDVGTSVGAPSFDIEGMSRPQGNGYDMGAYEFNPDEFPWELFIPIFTNSTRKK